MRLVFGRDAEVIDWVAQRVSYFSKEALGPCVAIGLERDGKLAAGIICSSMTLDPAGKPNDMEFTIAHDMGGGLVGPGVLRALFGYVFGQAGCRRITTYIAGDNERSRSTVERMGFKQEGRLRDGIGPGLDLFIYGLMRDECRYWRRV